MSWNGFMLFLDLFRLPLEASGEATTVSTAQDFDPFQNGPYETMHKTFYPILTSGLDHILNVWAPDSAEVVNTPIVYFISAFGGIMPGECYKDLFTKVASHGVTIVEPSMLGNDPVSNYQGIWMDDIMEWAETHLRKELSNAVYQQNAYLGLKEGLVLDHDSLFIMGHSAGGHVAVEYLKHHCGKAKGSILISPVDGFDPYGLIDIEAITPGQYLNYAIPSLVLVAGLDNVKGIDGAGAIMPACAPNDMSNKRFYDAMAGQTWLVNATYYGHGDALDDYWADTVQWVHFCAAASEDHSLEEYRRHLSGEISTFIKYVMGQEDCSVLKYLQEPALMPVETTVLYKPSVAEPELEKCSQSECKWQSDPYKHN